MNLKKIKQKINPSFFSTQLRSFAARLLVLIIVLIGCGHQSLPAQQTVGLFLNSPSSQNGYTLWSPYRVTYLIDNCGRLVHSWDSDAVAGLSAYLLEDGSLLRAGRQSHQMNGPGLGGRLERWSWEGELLWQYDYLGDDFHQHHDIEPMPNGNVLVLAWKRITAERVTAAGAAFEQEYWATHIAELEPVGTNEANVVWEWSLWDHLIQDHDSSKANFGVVAEHPELMNVNFNPPAPASNSSDWMHCNSISYNPQRDEILLSSREMNEIYIIDHSTTSEEAAGHTGGQQGRGGDFLYRWGNPRAYDRGDADDQRLFGQHDARWVPEGHPQAGQLQVFNNGYLRPAGEFSSVDIWQAPIDAQGHYQLAGQTAYGPQALSWQYVHEPPEDLYTGIMGGAQVLSNGNVLICQSRANRFWEVSPEGQVVWQYVNPTGIGGTVSQGQTPGNSLTFRATRYLPDYAGLQGRVLNPGDPIELEPFMQSCELYETPVSTQEPATEQVLPFGPNPFSDQLTWRLPSSELTLLQVFNREGKIIWEQKTRADGTLNTQAWPSGLYLLRMQPLEHGLTPITWKVVKY